MSGKVWECCCHGFANIGKNLAHYLKYVASLIFRAKPFSRPVLDKSTDPSSSADVIGSDRVLENRRSVGLAEELDWTATPTIGC